MTAFRVLHALRVKGVADVPVIAELADMDASVVQAELAGAQDAGLAVHRAGRVTGWALTAAGRAAHAESLVACRGQDGDLDALASAYRLFEPVNAEFKATCAAWQLRDGQVDAIKARVRSVNAAAGAVFDAMTAALPRFDVHARRLRRALDRFEAGDDTALTAPLSDSYHDVWMELHQDLILTLGLTRRESDA